MTADHPAQPVTQQAADPVLRTERLSVNFRGLKAVDHVDIAVAPGRITSIIGPNGAGKSTLFNLISGAIRPTSGQVFLEGKDVTGLAPHRIEALGLARSFQITNVFPQKSVFENLRLAAQILEPSFRGFLPVERSARARAKAEELIEHFGLSASATELAGHLSHGQQRRLEIAMALASEPRVLLLDEPTQGMAHSDTEQTSELVKSLAGHLTVVLIEHDIDLVMALSDTVIVLHLGRKLADGTPRQVRDDPAVQEAYFGGR